MQLVKDEFGMIKKMSPQLIDGEYVFVTLKKNEVDVELLKKSKSSFVENEGLSLILELGLAQQKGFDTSLKMMCISLNVYSDLEGVGLTAAVSSALAEQKIPCNIVAAYHHDHAFVPSIKAKDALKILRDLELTYSNF